MRLALSSSILNMWARWDPLRGPRNLRVRRDGFRRGESSANNSLFRAPQSIDVYDRELGYYWNTWSKFIAMSRYLELRICSHEDSKHSLPTGLLRGSLYMPTQNRHWYYAHSYTHIRYLRSVGLA